ncbi:major facilitator superfamily domain-containing protein [Geopyxis carbonaria]|nr:major facilitator superfamily domain-containing protein [Geopyxis carbonaria]
MANDEETANVTQAGVLKVQALSQVWTKKWLWFAYFGIICIAFSTSLGEQVGGQLTPFATSSFGHHSLLSTVSVIAGVLNAVFQPPMAKFADVFGRTEAFTLATCLYTLGYTLQARAGTIGAYAAAKIFEASGVTGLKILEQVFVADTSDLANRVIMSSLPDVPFVVNVWIAPLITERFQVIWRWGYGMWAIITPVATLPLIMTLWYHQRKATRLIRRDLQSTEKPGLWAQIKNVAIELDIGGLFLITGGFALLLVPLTLTRSSVGQWKNSGIITSMVLGVLLLLAFPFWECSPTLAPRPLITKRLLKNRTVLCACLLAFFYFMAFFLSLQPYFMSYLIVTRNMSTKSAGYMMNIFSVSCTFSVLGVGVLTKYTARYKVYMLIGIAMYSIGIGLMLKYRNIGAPIGTLIFTQILVGVGGGFINGPAQLGLQASASHQEVGSATALFLMCLSLGGAVGSAVSGAVWSSMIHTGLARHLPAEVRPELEAIFGDMTKAASYPMGSPAREAIRLVYDNTMHRLITIAVCVCIPLLPLAWGMENLKLNQVDTGRVNGAVVVGSSKKKRVSEDEEMTL